MGLMGTYRESGNIAKGTNAGRSGSAGIMNFTGFKPSGLVNGNAMAVCLYVYSSAGYPNPAGHWIPLKVEYLR